MVSSRPVLLATHTAVGVMSTPAGPLGTGTRATTRFVRGSIRITTLSSLEVTQTASPVAASPKVRIPAGMVAVIRFVAGSIRTTALRSLRPVHTLPAPQATPLGRSQRRMMKEPAGASSWSG